MHPWHRPHSLQVGLFSLRQLSKSDSAWTMDTSLELQADSSRTVSLADVSRCSRCMVTKPRTTAKQLPGLHDCSRGGANRPAPRKESSKGVPSGLSPATLTMPLTTTKAPPDSPLDLTGCCLWPAFNLPFCSNTCSAAQACVLHCQQSGAKE